MSANRTLGFLRRNLSACSQDVKESAYKELVRPVMEYGSSVWDISGMLLQEELEKVQKRAARFVIGNYIYETWSMTGILEQLKPTPPHPYPKLGMAESITLWHLKRPLLIGTRAVSSPRLLEIGIHLQILTFLLLKVQKTLLLSSPLL